MEAFNIFETGGREKFLKKKKDKKTKTQEDNKQISSVLLIQKNIQRFLEIKRANEKLQQKIQIEGQENKVKDLWNFWILTPYHVRTYVRGYCIVDFWQECFIGQNQVQFCGKALLNKMVKLTIEFLNQILKNNRTKGIKICQAIFELINTSRYQIIKNEAKSIINSFQSFKDQQMKELKKNFVDLLFENKESKHLALDLFTDQCQFMEYIMAKRIDVLQNKANFVKIQEIVCQCYPKILQENQRRIQLQEQGKHSWVLNNYENLCKLYALIFRWLEASQRPPQVLLIWIAFLNNLTRKLKTKTLEQINIKNKINPRIFESQEAYQEYLEQKEQYFLYRETITGANYEKTKILTRRFIEVLMVKKEIQIPAKELIYEHAMQYVNEVLVTLGQVDILPMNQAINFFIENVNQTIIYALGKQTGFFTEKKNLSVENKLLLALTIALKSAIQTPDLYFIKFYQEASEKQKLKKLIKEYLLKTLKQTMFLPHSTPTIQLITRTTISLLENLYNKIFRTSILSPQIFENSSFASKFKNYEFRKNVKDEVSLFLTQFPYVFPLPERVAKFREILRNQRYHYNRFGYGLNEDEEEQYIENAGVKIRRNYEFVDAFHQLNKKDMRKGFKIVFINQLGFEEKGFDAGGLTKEFLNRVLKDALNPNFGMFIENSVHELLPHPTKAELTQGIETEYYEFIGKLIGLAIYLNITLGYKFSGTFLNAIVGKKNTFDDLKTIDPQLYKSLVYIKDMEEDAAELGLTFLYKDDIRKKNIQLLPNGHMIPVTNQNKRQFISLLTAYKVNRLLEHQTRYIRKGLTSTVNKEWLFMFNYEELNYLISGQGVINVEDLKKYTRVLGFDENKTSTIRYFWEVVREFSEEQKSKLLMFVTACPRPSFLGFKELSPPFTIICMKDSEGLLPISHTCSNVLELPDYDDKKTLRKKLTIAIESNAGFEFG